MSEFTTVAKVGAIQPGDAAAFTINDRVIAVFFDGEAYRAINDVCPHMGASLATGHFEDGVVICPWHAWKFKVCDGTWVDNPKLTVDTYEIRVDGDEIQVKTG